MTLRTNRRKFLKTAGASAGVALAGAFPTIASSRAFGGPNRVPPSDRIRIAHIGVGNRGGQNLGALLKYPSVETAAVCDVDANYLAAARQRVERKTGRACAAYRDYRELLDDKSIDAVVVTTPDHWHALPTVHACQAGKDVYCEKPLTLTIAEGRAMVAAARRHGRIVQTGSQQRSDEKFRRACELVRSGRIGKVHTIRVGISDVNFNGESVADCPPPPELDFDFWLGPAPKRPYNPRRVHYNFRFFWDYSGGQMTNWGAHHLDVAQWGLGADDGGPVSAVGKARYHRDKLYEVPEWCEVIYKYAGGTTLICGHDQRGGTLFEGEQGKIFVSRKVLESTPVEIVKEPRSSDDVSLYVSDDHYGNWLDCIKSRKPPICDAAIGHRSATVCHLGNIAIRTGRSVNWDPVKEEITGDAESASMVSRPYRAPWSLPQA